MSLKYETDRVQQQAVRLSAHDANDPPLRPFPSKNEWLPAFKSRGSRGTREFIDYKTSMITDEDPMLWLFY